MNTKKLPTIQYSLVALSKMKFRSYASEFLESLTSQSTKDAYQKDISVFLVFIAERNPEISLLPANIKLQDVLDYKELMLLDGQSNATVNRRLGAVKSFAVWAAKNMHMTKIDLKSVTLPKVSKELSGEPFTDDEINKMIQAPNLSEHKGRAHRLIMYFMMHLGLNRSEIAELRVSSIINKEDDTYLKVGGRSGKERHVKLTLDMKLEMAKYLKAYHFPLGPTDFLIQTEMGQKNITPIDGSTIFRIIDRYAKALKIHKKASPRTFRRTAIQNMLASNHFHVEHVASELGHINSRTTERYLSNLPKRISSENEQVNIFS